MAQARARKRARGEDKMPADSPAEPLYWDASYAIARRLIDAHPGVRPDELTLVRVYEWTLALPDFADEPALANDELLEAILQEWYEESSADDQS
jgi:FeS assembly protein IscX